MYFNYLTKTLLILPRTAKRFIVLALDVFLCALTVWLAFYLRLGELLIPRRFKHEVQHGLRTA